MALDLSQKDDVEQRHDRGVKVLIRGEFGDPDTYVDEAGQTQQSWVMMAGVYSRRYRRKKQEQENRKWDNSTLREGKFVSDGMELVCACTMEWGGFVYNGEPLNCTPHNAQAIYKAFPWVYRQCDEAMNEPANFSPPA